MSPAADFQINSNHTSSADVFGNELEDVDVWGDGDQSGGRPSKERVCQVVQEAIRIAERLPGFQGALSKPPRTPHARRRTMQLELLQRELHSQKNMSPKGPLRRSTGSESDLLNRSASPQKSVSDSHSHLPPMTPRTRMRKMGLHNMAPVAPSLMEVSPKPKTLSVAEKRRLRNNNASTRALNIPAETDLDHSFSAFEEDNDDLLDEFAQSRTSGMDLMASTNGNGQHARRRSSSDGALIFSQQELLFKQTPVLSRDGFKDVEEIRFAPAHPGSPVEESPEDKSQVVIGKAPRHRESRAEREEVHVRRRSGSASRKKHIRRNSRTSSHHKQSQAPIDSMPPLSRLTKDEVEADDAIDNLQSHLKNMLGLNDEQASPRCVNLKNSVHSGSTNSNRSPNGPQLAIDEKKPTSPLKEEATRKRSTSKIRREPKKSPSNSEKDAPSPRSDSAPRAGQKIKFVRKSETEKDWDGMDCKSMRSGKSKVSRSSVKSSKSSKSTKSKRRSSIATNCPPSPRPPPSVDKPGTVVRSRSECPPSPAVKMEQLARSRSDSHTGPTRNKQSSRADNCSPSPAAERRRSADKATPSSSTPRRKIKFIKQGSRDSDDMVHPPILTLGL